MAEHRNAHAPLPCLSLQSLTIKFRKLKLGIRRAGLIKLEAILTAYPNGVAVLQHSGRRLGRWVGLCKAT